MGNLVLGIPFGGQHGFGVRPYGLVGMGLMRSSVKFGGLCEVDENKFAWDFGGGVIIFFGSNFGIRGDVRYFRTFEALDVSRHRHRRVTGKAGLHPGNVRLRLQVLIVATT